MKTQNKPNKDSMKQGRRTRVLRQYIHSLLQEPVQVQVQVLVVSKIM